MIKIPHIDFIGKRKLFLSISAILIAIVALGTIIFGVDLDIRFKGGTIISYVYQDTDKQLNINDVEKTAQKVLGEKVTISRKVNLLNKNSTFDVNLAKSQTIEDSKQEELTKAITSAYPDNKIEYSSITTVNASMGKSFLAKCLVAVLLGIIIMTLYIAIRFRIISGWSAGITAVIALIHDMIIVFGAFVLLRFAINDSFMAVILTILGYSANDTVIIYDRIRENKRLYGNKKELSEIVNLSINQTLTRSINTTITTIVTMLVVSIVALLMGVTSIISFSIPMIIGLIVGAYSSICVATQIWYIWETSALKSKKKKSKSKKK